MKRAIVIAGGGIAALEAALALRHLGGERVEVTICSPRRDFVYRPYALGVPFGVARVATHDLADLAARAGARYRADSIASVDRDARLAVTHDGEGIAYDDLILCPGAKLLWPVPGAITFWGIADERDVAKVMASVRAGTAHRVAFTMPTVESWALPLYELALLARGELDRAGATAELTIVTPEDAPLQAFGRAASERLAGLLAERRIAVVTGTHPVRFAAGVLQTVPAGRHEFDAVVSLPKLEGRRIRGVPHDVEGFIRIDGNCRVLGCEPLFAAGDVTSFPVKQGGIATQQADIVAETIVAAMAGAPAPREFDPVFRGLPWETAEPQVVGRHLAEFLAEA